MSEESATPDLAERWRKTFEVFAHRDFDALMKFYAHHAVWDASSLGIDTFEGRAAIRRVLEEWIAPYEEYEAEFEECRDPGNGVVFAVAHQAARPPGSTRSVQDRPAAFVFEWVDGMVVRGSVYYDIDEARAAGERRAEERG